MSIKSKIIKTFYIFGVLAVILLAFVLIADAVISGYAKNKLYTDVATIPDNKVGVV